MKFKINRDTLLNAMQSICGVVERKPVMEAYANVFLRVARDKVTLITSDGDVELSTQIHQDFPEEKELLTGARKLLDICRTLPEDSMLDVDAGDSEVRIRSARSQFKLRTYPRDSFALVDVGEQKVKVRLDSVVMRRMIAKTQFSMADNDVRYYLNGLLLELRDDGVSAVATDGHRLALSEVPVDTGISETRQIIIPKKGVTELNRILSRSEEVAELNITANHISLSLGDERFTSKLIDGNYPDFRRVLPAESATPVIANREELHKCLERVSILDAERHRGVEMNIGSEGCLQLSYKNSEEEEVQVELDIEYEGEPIETGFNVRYLLNVLEAIESEKVLCSIEGADGKCMIRADSDESERYLIMPMNRNG